MLEMYTAEDGINYRKTESTDFLFRYKIFVAAGSAISCSQSFFNKAFQLY